MNRRWLLCTWLIAASMEAGNASEAEMAYRFNITARTAEVGLTELAKQSGTPLLYDHDVIAGVKSARVVGVYTLKEALSRLLSGSPLEGYISADGVIVAIRAKEKPEGVRDVSGKRTTGRQLVAAVAGAVSIAGTAASQTITAEQQEPATTRIEEIVVTASSRPESLSQVVSTVSLIDQDMIDKSASNSIGELLSENAVAFLSEWSPGQTQINLRGGTTDGQGRDFRSQVLVLLNGRRAGTANVSKLSPAAVSRVEIVRGPSSVIYGSQNIGGVVNIITKSGANAAGGEVQLAGGSWDFFQGNAQLVGGNGSFDWFLGSSYSQRDDYDAGKGGGTQINTGWERKGVTATVGYQFESDDRLQVTARTDGIYDAGFRGSSANYISQEDRYNRSLDLQYTGTAGGAVDWLAHAYFVNDVDDFHWASPVISVGGSPAPGTASDHNKRNIDIVGSRIQPRFQFGDNNDLLIGWDWEHSKVRSTRERIGVEGANISQVAPFDNNQTEDVHALYFEDVHRLMQDRLTLRGGLRWTTGETGVDATPNRDTLVPSTQDYDATTFAVGATFKATDALTLRAGVSSGFRAPNATELAAEFTSVGGNQTFGNPDLEPESSDQVEVGMRLAGAAWSGDLAIFRNEIKDRIVSRPRPGVAATSDYMNNEDEVIISGLELQFDTSLLELTNRATGDLYWNLSGGGSYHWDMEDKGAPASANTTNVQRVYKYQAALTTEFGRTDGASRDWSLHLKGVLHGPIWYNTEERLLIPLAEPNTSYIHKKGAFWVWNLRSELQLSDNWDLSFSINNLFDENYNPIFIAIDKQPYLLNPAFSNGGLGTSMPGREFRIAVRTTFGNAD